MDPFYYFLIASFIAVIANCLIIGNTMNQIRRDGKNKSRHLTKMFAQIGIIEALPIVLVVFGFMDLEQSSIDKSVAGTLLFVLTLFGIGYITLRYKRLSEVLRLKRETKQFMQTSLYMGFALIVAIPLVSFVALLVI